MIEAILRRLPRGTAIRRQPAANLPADVAALRWFHSIDLGNGIVTPGVIPLRVLKAQAAIYFADDVSGRTVLDIGAWDGFNAIEAVRRGTSRVMATDHWVWKHHPWASRATIELARDRLAPLLEIADIDVPDLTPERVGSFDVVLFAGVLYHVRHPLLTLEKVARLAANTLIVETHLDARRSRRPAMIFYPGTELNGDGSNWWGPNRPCVEAMLRDVGFEHIEYARHPTAPDRGIFRAKR